MNKSDLAPIRARLETLQHDSNSHSEVAEPPWEHPRSPELPKTSSASGAGSQAELNAAVQALQRRSQNVEHIAPQEELTHAAASQAAPPIPPEVNLHWQRLQQEAVLVNELAEKQAIAVQNFKRIADRLAWSLRRYPSAYGSDVGQFCVLEEAIVSQILQDDQGRLLLHNVAVDLHEDERSASQTAQDVRDIAQARTHIKRETMFELPLQMRDSMTLLTRLWSRLTTTLETRSRLTLLDVVMWLGGGLIGRLALQLALAAVPGLWPWIVGLTLGTVVFALYRLLFTSQTDIAFVSRLFLALVGLVLGGQLGGF